MDFVITDWEKFKFELQKISDYMPDELEEAIRESFEFSSFEECEKFLKRFKNGYAFVTETMAGTVQWTEWRGIKPLKYNSDPNDTRHCIDITHQVSRDAQDVMKDLALDIGAGEERAFLREGPRNLAPQKRDDYWDRGW